MDAERVLQTLEGWACSEYQLPEDGEGEEDAQQQQPKQPQKQRLTGRKRARQDTILRGLDFLMQDERDKLDNAIQVRRLAFPSRFSLVPHGSATDPR